MSAANFAKALQFTLQFEGLFSKDRADPGNWTGGKVGVGALKGTMRGIAASSHPALDIEHLTLADVTAIYRHEYWNAIGGDALAPGVDLILFDSAVNHGVGRAKKWLTLVGQEDPAHEITDIAALRISLWRRQPSFSHFGKGWLTRGGACEKAALALVGKA